MVFDCEVDVVEDVPWMTGNGAAASFFSCYFIDLHNLHNSVHHLI